MLLRPVLMPILRNPLQGIADGIRNMLAELLGSSQFFAPLTHSLVLARGTGSPTFTRADATNCATFRDWEGVLKTVPSGCARFEGARMVRNLLAFTEDLTNAAWIVDGGATKTNATTVTFTAVADRDLQQIVTTDSTVVGRKFVFSVTLALQSGTPSLDSDIKLRAEGTSISGEQTQNIGLSISSTPTRFSFVITTTAAGTTVITGIQSDIACAITFTEAQLEDVTGQADQTASEYVSVGVESAPYHGAGVDGVEFFNTDRDGAVIPAATNTGYLAEGARTNLCLQSNAFNTTWTENGAVLTCTQNVVGPDGATSAWTFTDDSAVAIEGRAQAITLTAAAYTFSVFVKKTTGATVYPAIFALAGTTFSGATIDTNSGVCTPWVSFDALTPAAGMSANCVSHNSSYWRASLTFTGTVASWTHLICPAIATSPTQSAFVGATVATLTGSAVFYGAQVELGSSASTYIPTTTAAVTRAADVLTYPVVVSGSNSIYAEVTPSDRENFTALVLDDGTTNNREFFLDSTASPGLARFFVASGGATQADIEVTTLTSGVTFKAAGSVATNSAKFAVNGTLGTEDTSVTVPAASTTLHVGTNTAGAALNPLTIRNVRIWQRQLSASEMQAITA